MRKYNINVKAALAVFAIVLSGCSSDNDIVDNNSNNQEKPVTNKTMSFRASMDGETTRTDFNGNSTIWTDNDAISIMNTASVPEETDRPTQADFTISEGVGTKEATFTGGPIRANGNNADNFYAFYPATTLSTSNNAIKASASVPTVQTAIDGSYDQSLHFMSAYSTNSTFNFKNVCSLIKITLTNNTSVCRVKVVANPTLTSMDAQEFTYTSITGNFDATIGSDGTASVTATDAKSTYVELRANGDNGTAKTVIGNGTFYMVVLPATISNGFTLLLEKTNGTIYQRIGTKVTAFERNKMYDFGSFDCSGTPSGMTELTNVIDLDMPSGTLWATKNLNSSNSLVSSAKITGFASSETDDGGFFSWGYKEVTSALGGIYSLPGLDQTNTTLAGTYEVVYTYDQKYCMPIYAQLYELYNNITDKSTGSVSTGLISSRTYAKFTSPTGRILSLPYAGYYYSGVHTGQNTQARYWSRTYTGRTWEGTPEYYAYCLDLKITNNVPEVDLHPGLLGANSWNDKGEVGRTIRPVATNIQIAPIY